MMVSFIAGDAWQDSAAKLVYRDDEQSFDFEGTRPSGVTSLLIDYLQLEVNEAGAVLYAWGLCPRAMWQPMHGVPPVPTRRTLYAQLGEELIPGVSKRISDETQWPVRENAATGWVCVGDPDAVGDREPSIEFAPGCVAVLRRDKLLALWLRPT